MSADNVVRDLLAQGLPARQVAVLLHEYFVSRDDHVSLADCTDYVLRWMRRNLAPEIVEREPQAPAADQLTGSTLTTE